MASNIANANPLPYFNAAQVFQVSKTLAPNNVQIAITAVNVYFEYMPQSNNNSTTIQNPGITIFLANTIFGVPRITSDSLSQFARCEFGQIMTSSDASIPTQFIFNTPVMVTPGQNYALVLSYDGNETFVPWTAVAGEWVAGTRNIYSGSSSQLVGGYFEYNSNSGDTVNTPLTASTQAQYQEFWTALNNTQLTFDVFAARYFISGVPVTQANVAQNTPIYSTGIFETYNANTSVTTFSYPLNNPEALVFNPSTSTVQSFIGAQRVYQNTVAWPGGYSNGATYAQISVISGNTIVTANATLPNGQSFNWNNIFPSLSYRPYITIVDPQGTNIRRVLQIASNTIVQLDEPVTFTNTIAKFLVSPVGTVDSVMTDSPYGKSECILFLNGSNANQSVRFVNNSITTFSVGTGTGTSYSNSDILYVQGFQNVATLAQGGYPAIANIQTNATGGIINVYFSNVGAGFVNTSTIAVVVSNSTSGNTTSNTSAGSGATITFTSGQTVITESTQNQFQNCVVANFNLDDVTPFCQIYNPIGTTYSLSYSTQYQFTQNTSVFGGFGIYVNPQQFSNLSLSQLNFLLSNTPAAFVSRSNEYNAYYANGSINNLANSAAPYSNAVVLAISTQTTIADDYIAVNVQSTPTIEFGHYNVNNSYYNEYQNSGNAYSKHITTAINFNQITEDIRVYLTVYQPVNTSFVVFARIQNPNDPQTFGQEDWTLLQQVSGQGLFSSTTDRTDYVSLGYGFPQWPQGNSQLGAFSTLTLSNTVTTSNNSNTVTGSGFVNQGNLVANSIVRIYAPLFSNADYIVASVVGSPTDTSITLDQAINSNTNIGGNPALVGSGLALDVLYYNHQAFNNLNNENIVRYYNQSTHRFDGYGTLEIKVVFQSSKLSYIPEINNIVVYGVTA